MSAQTNVVLLCCVGSGTSEAVFKAWVCGRSLAEISGLNPAEGKNNCLLRVLCVVRQNSLRLADYSSRACCVLLTVISKPR
jgi:hypothetical protein